MRDDYEFVHAYSITSISPSSQAKEWQVYHTGRRVSWDLRTATYRRTPR